MPELTEGAVNRDCWEETRGGSSDSRESYAQPWAASRSEQPEPRQLAKLVRTIEGEIIPRLMLLHGVAALHPPASDGKRAMLAAESVEEFTRLILTHDTAAASSYVAALRARGVSTESLYLDLLAPTARRLGDLWVLDLCDFMEVTLGLWRLHQLLHELSADFQSGMNYTAYGSRTLLMPTPGEQHVFGIFMVAEFFRRDGWQVWEGFPTTVEELIKIVSHEWFDVIGFSLNCEVRLEALATAIHAVRRASQNRAVGVLVGGQLFNARPELAVLVGADTTAADGRQAVVQAQQLRTLLAGSP